MTRPDFRGGGGGEGSLGQHTMEISKKEIKQGEGKCKGKGARVRSMK